MHVYKVISHHLIESVNGKNLLTWSFPSITDEMRQFILGKCFVVAKQSNIFYCLRNQNLWVYVHQILHENNNIALVIVSQECDVAKYKFISDLFIKCYLSKKNPVDLVKLHLKFKSGGGQLVYDKKPTNSKELVEKFQQETVLIYLALLYKTRLLVYSSDLEKLQDEILSMACLVSRWNLSEYFLPLVETPSELKRSFYLAGVHTDLSRRIDLYDVFVNLDTGEVNVSEKMQGIFTNSKVRNSMAKYFLEVAQSDMHENELQQELERRTEELLRLLNIDCKIQC